MGARRMRRCSPGPSGGPSSKTPRGDATEPRVLYRPYLAGTGDKRSPYSSGTTNSPISSVLSIPGWDYTNGPWTTSWPKLLAVRNSLPGDRDFVVSIILDGENAWEYYRNDGQ
ncbi:MAG: hypothetical protein MZV70_00995 [Desulfobacterales bacterium]|nr:hypothetical protein [Desulfobacterales bacterium]